GRESAVVWRGVGMVVVTYYLGDVVILAIQINNDASLPGQPAQQPHEIQPVAKLKFCGPLVEEDRGVGRIYIERVIERRGTWWLPVESDLMPKFLGHRGVMVHVLRAAAVLNDPMHEYQPHVENLMGPPNIDRMWNPR